jgi:hypothetical protein
MQGADRDFDSDKESAPRVSSSLKAFKAAMKRQWHGSIGTIIPFAAGFCACLRFDALPST